VVLLENVGTFYYKYPAVTVRSTTGIPELSKKMRSVGSCLGKKLITYVLCLLKRIFWKYLLNFERYARTCGCMREREKDR
jgi:hypothetical protein